jgi:hypothetical protein
MKYEKFVAAFAMCLLCGLAVAGVAQSGFPAFVSTNVRKAACAYTGGRFDDFMDRCYSRSCYASHDCGRRGDNNLRCAGLKTGEPVSEVYFLLGEPDGEEGGQYRWPGWKLDGGTIAASFEDGKLKTINCPAR